MAITSARMQIKRGNESEFDPEKMLPGEWALSIDKKIVRICVAPNVCIRMATYDAFEADVAKIQGILEEVQTIEEAVTRINTEISEKANAVAEYTEQAKGYRDETKQFRDGAETSATNAKSSEDKAKVSETNAKVSETNAKISEQNAQRVAESLPEDYTELSKAFYNTAIKQKAVGDNIHVTDSAEAKNIEFGLYGKAEQKRYSGKNLLENTASNTTSNGITFTVNEDKSVTINGANNGTQAFTLNIPLNLVDGVSYTVNGITGGSDNTYQVYLQKSDGSVTSAGYLVNGEKTFTKDSDKYNVAMYRIRVSSGASVNNVTIYPMIRLASITDSTYEPYVGGIASPNPDYPQEITVSGSDGSVEVVSCGKNVCSGYEINKAYKNATGEAMLGVPNYNASNKFKVKDGKTYIVSNGLGLTPSDTHYWDINGNWLGSKSGLKVNDRPMGTKYVAFNFYSSVGGFDIGWVQVEVGSGTVATPYQPYTETVSTIPTPNGLAGIEVSSGGNYTDENGQQWLSDGKYKYADGSGENIQRIGIEVFDGSDDEGWIEAKANVTRFMTNAIAKKVLKPTAPSVIANILCNQFVPKSANNTYLGIKGVSVEINGNVSVYDENITTLEEWKTHLSEKPMIFLYELAEPIITDLSAEEIAEIEKLHTFYPITNISNDADCGMSITYLCDAKNYINHRLALIESAIINNI